MDLKLNNARLFSKDSLKDPVNAFECIMYNKLFGIPMNHYLLRRTLHEK